MPSIVGACATCLPSRNRWGSAKIVTEQTRKWNALRPITYSQDGTSASPAGLVDPTLNRAKRDSQQNQRVVSQQQGACAPPIYCMFLLKRFEPQITTIQIANMKANPTITISMAALRSIRLVPSAKHATSSICFLACRNRVAQGDGAIRLLDGARASYHARTISRSPHEEGWQTRRSQDRVVARASIGLVE